MSALADLRVLAAAPWIGALIVALAPARFGRVLAAAAAIVVAAAALAAAGGAAPIAGLWLARGAELRLGLEPLTVVGVAVVGIFGALAALAERRATRGHAARTLALQGIVLAGLLAQDVVAIAGVWTLVPALALVSLAVPGDPAGRRAGRALALWLSVGAGLTALAGAGLLVAHHGASGGAWSGSLAELAAVRVPPSLALPLAGALALVGALGLGLWPLHSGMVAGTAVGPRSVGLLRWLGLDALVRLWAPLVPVGAAASAPWLAGLSVAGAVYAGLVARAEREPARRAGLLALVPWSLAALGVATLSHEGLVGAIALGIVGTLGQVMATRAGPIERAALGLAGALGGALVVVAALRFSNLTLGAFGPWAACGAAVALVLAGSALASLGEPPEGLGGSRRRVEAGGPIAQGERDRPKGAATVEGVGGRIAQGEGDRPKGAATVEGVGGRNAQEGRTRSEGTGSVEGEGGPIAQEGRTRSEGTAAVEVGPGVRDEGAGSGGTAAGGEDEGQGAEDRFAGAGARLAAGLGAAGLILLAVRPAAALERVIAAGEAWVEAIALQRCMSIHAPKTLPVLLDGSGQERCEAPLAALREAQEAQERGGPGGA